MVDFSHLASDVSYDCNHDVRNETSRYQMLCDIVHSTNKNNKKLGTKARKYTEMKFFETDSSTC